MRGWEKIDAAFMIPFARFLSAVISTLILYQCALVAPAINIALPVEPAAIMLRFIWPIFFALVGILGVVGVLASKTHKWARMVNLVTVLGMLVCYFLVPVINGAKDGDQMVLWKVLHMVTVALTFLSLILHLLFIFRWHKKN
ncbi:MAG: hypothetical protein AAGC74_00975 [Verrucomicrobiota bacterium]